MDGLDTFIANARRLMEERKWKQNDLARKAGLPNTTVSAILNRKYEPGVFKMEAIAKALGTTLPQMLTPEDEYARHLRNVQRSPPEDQRYIFTVAERAAKYGEDG